MKNQITVFGYQKIQKNQLTIPKKELKIKERTVEYEVVVDLISELKNYGLFDVIDGIFIESFYSRNRNSLLVRMGEKLHKDLSILQLYLNKNLLRQREAITITVEVYYRQHGKEIKTYNDITDMISSTVVDNCEFSKIFLRKKIIEELKRALISLQQNRGEYLGLQILGHGYRLNKITAIKNLPLFSTL